MTQIDANGHLLPIQPPTPEVVPEQPRWTIGRSMIAVAAAAFLLGVVRPLYLISDAEFGGPLTRAFQERYLRVSIEANLVGRPEADIVAVLGSPTSISEFQEFLLSRPTRVYRYAPSWSTAGSFQVVCHAGVVSGVREEEPDKPM